MYFLNMEACGSVYCSRTHYDQIESHSMHNCGITYSKLIRLGVCYSRLIQIVKFNQKLGLTH
jgi:hypothetical protein